MRRLIRSALALALMTGASAASAQVAGAQVAGAQVAGAQVAGAQAAGAQVGAAQAAGAEIRGVEVPGYAQKVAGRLRSVDAAVGKGPFKSDWDSLSAYRTPEWFRDAKFGIFIHWGVYSVPGFANEWYPRSMYVKGTAPYEFHRAAFGPQDKFGYKDFIPMFKAEKFDAAAWADLFQRAGARYVVPVAEHCDGFAMYDSDFTEWDAAKMGPHRDVVGEIAKASRARGLHFGLSSHRAEHWWWYSGGREFDSDVNDPRYAGLYGPAAPRNLPADSPKSEPDPGQLQNWLPPSKEFLDDWLARTTELVDKYQPELVYLDWWTAAPLFEPDMRTFAAYYYDKSAAKKQAGIIAYKGNNFAEGTALFDIERGRSDNVRLKPWQTDTSVSLLSWGYVKDDKYRTAKSLVADLADVVSKNGNLLLNVGPKPDGTIPQEAQDVLLGIGDWLKVNGEAIYGTRPFTYYGEGPTRVATARVGGQVEDAATKAYTAADIRFTTRGDTLYIIGLERPQDGAVLVKTLYAGTPYLKHAIGKVEMLGGGAVQWRQTAKGLELTLPAADAAAMPYALRVSMAS